VRRQAKQDLDVQADSGKVEAILSSGNMLQRLPALKADN